MEVLLSFYSLLSLLLALIWLLFFYRAPDIRGEMIILGLFSLFLLPTTLLLSDSTNNIDNVMASLTLFDLIFTFTVAGIAGVIYHFFLGKTYHRIRQTKKTKKQTVPNAQLWLLRLLITMLVFVWSVILFGTVLNVPTAFAILLAAILLALYMLYHRYDLLEDVLLSGILTAIIVFISGATVSILVGATLDVSLVESTVRFGAVPVDLLLWSLALGFAAGPVYEYSRHLTLK